MTDDALYNLLYVSMAIFEDDSTNTLPRARHLLLLHTGLHVQDLRHAGHAMGCAIVWGVTLHLKEL